MSGLTPGVVSEFWQYMLHRYGGSVIDKRSASEMQLVGALLGSLGIVDKDSFLRHYATTIGHRIYISIGVSVVTVCSSSASRPVTTGQAPPSAAATNC